MYLKEVTIFLMVVAYRLIHLQLVSFMEVAFLLLKFIINLNLVEVFLEDHLMAYSFVEEALYCFVLKMF